MGIMILATEAPRPVHELRSAVLETRRPRLHFARRGAAEDTSLGRIFEFYKQKRSRNAIATGGITAEIPE